MYVRKVAIGYPRGGKATETKVSTIHVPNTFQNIQQKANYVRVLPNIHVHVLKQNIQYLSCACILCVNLVKI